jgi:toxin ParE1/3/4
MNRKDMWWVEKSWEQKAWRGRRSRSFLVNSWQIDEIQKGLAEAEPGEFLSESEVKRVAKEVGSPCALANRNAEAGYIAEDCPAAARCVVEILRGVDLLRKNPAMGRAGRVAGARELVVAETPYIIPYRVRGDAVEILRVFHAVRKWPERVS